MNTEAPDAFLEVDYNDCHDDPANNLACIRDQLADCIALLTVLKSLGHEPLANAGTQWLHAFIMPGRGAFLDKMQTECAKHGIRMELG